MSAAFIPALDAIAPFSWFIGADCGAVFFMLIATNFNPGPRPGPATEPTTQSIPA